MKYLAIGVIAAGLSACGGGGESNSGPSGVSPQTGNGGAALLVDGIYSTTTTSSYSVTYSILPSGEYYGYVIRGIQPAGLVHGTATGSGTSIQSNNLGFYDFLGPNGGTLVNGGTLSGTFGTTNILTAAIDGVSTGPLTAQATRYSGADARSLYNTPPTLGQLAGTYRGAVYSAGASQNYATGTALAIRADGTFNGSFGNCQASGSLTPSASGKGIMGATLAVSGAACKIAGQTGTGIATPTRVLINESGSLTYASILLQFLSNNGGAALVFDVAR